MKETNKHTFKIGDIVVRYKNGSNWDKTYDTPFIITKISISHVYDDNNRLHDMDNVKLVSPKSEIINDYEIF